MKKIDLSPHLFSTCFLMHSGELTWADRLAAEEIVKASGKSEYRMRDVIRNLVIHPIFSELDEK